MKERFDKAYATQARIALADDSPDAPWPMDKENLQRSDRHMLVRKGVSGGWSSTMSEEQSQRLDKIFMEKTKNIPEIRKIFQSAK